MAERRAFDVASYVAALDAERAGVLVMDEAEMQILAARIGDAIKRRRP